MTVYDFIYNINHNQFPYGVENDSKKEWEIAAEYLPEGNTKTMVKAIVLNRIHNNKSEAIKILKEQLEKTHCYMVYELLNSYDNENYSTEEEMNSRYKIMQQYENVDFTVEVQPRCVMDIVGDKFKPGCPFYDDIKKIVDESAEYKLKINSLFNEVMSAATSEDLQIKINAYVDCLKKDLRNDISWNTIVDNYVKVYEMLGEKPELYSEGLLKFIEVKLGLIPYEDYDRASYCTRKDNHPTTYPLIKLVLEKGIVNDELIHFLYCLSDKDDFASSRTENIILYSKIFEIKRMQRPAKRYLEIAKSKEDFDEKYKLFE